jgi:hypothetical protein
VVIVCASHIVAGEVIFLLVWEGLDPATDFHFDATVSDALPVSISITRPLSAEQAARLRAQIARVVGASVH